MTSADTELPADCETQPDAATDQLVGTAGAGIEALLAASIGVQSPSDAEIETLATSLMGKLTEYFVSVPDPKMPVLVLPADMRHETVMVIDSIAEERRRQDRMWGGPHHDDRHDRDTWLALIYDNLAKAGRELKDEQFFEHLRAAAALCCAAIESMTRVTDEIDKEVSDHLAALPTGGCQPPQAGE